MKEDVLKKLTTHFSRRVFEQTRTVIADWYRLGDTFWNRGWREMVLADAIKLQKTSQKYGFSDIATLIELFVGVMQETPEDRSPDSKRLEELADIVHSLSIRVMRHSDDKPESATFGKKYILLGMSDERAAEQIARQLGSFGISVETVSGINELMDKKNYRIPSMLILEEGFGQDQPAVEVIEELQGKLSPKIPSILVYHQTLDMDYRLRALRAGVISLVHKQLDLSAVVESFEHVHQPLTPKPFRALVMDDSKVQATNTTRQLNNAGIIVKTVTEPRALIEAVESFQPELILMDMYMPQCTGTELASLLRQDHQYDWIPIVYLSSEDDQDIIINAMSRAGDDFLTKPVATKMLVSTVQNRCRRTRLLKDQMVRDALTGLFDHRNVLEQLSDHVESHQRMGRQGAFAMIDIDYFKKVNDVHGHVTGDRVIKNLALLLRQRLRRTDIVGRYGGEEFAVIMPDTEIDDAQMVFFEVLERFRSINHGLEQDVFCSFSCGIAPFGSVASEQVVQTADDLLYQAKKAGRDQIMC